MTQDTAQWIVLAFLLAVCLRQQLMLDRGVTVPVTPDEDVTTDVLGNKFDVTLKQGRKHQTIAVYAINEGDVVRVLLARGIDINTVVEIKRG